MPSPIQLLLALESTLNILTLPPLLLTPSLLLTPLLSSSAPLNPPTILLTQILGTGLITLATAPLLLSYPETRNEGHEVVLARRRLTYAIMGVSEAVIGGVMGMGWVWGGSGVRDGVLVVGIGTMAVCEFYCFRLCVAGGG